MHRNKTSTNDSMKRPFLNDSKKSIVEPVTRERMEASKQMDPKKFCEILKKKLEELKVKRDKEERFQNALNEVNADEPPMCSKTFVLNANAGQVNHQAITSAILRKFSAIDLDNDQDILDQHVSRVFSPLVQSPGTSSPRQAAAISSRPPPLPHRSIDPMPDFGKWHAIWCRIWCWHSNRLTFTQSIHSSVMQPALMQCVMRNRYQTIRHAVHRCHENPKKSTMTVESVESVWIMAKSKRETQSQRE